MEINKDEPIVPTEPTGNMFDLPKKLKEHWTKEDEHCPACKQVTKRVTGLTKQNLKRLVIGVPTVYDWIFFFIIVMTIFLAYQYQAETAQSRDIVQNFDDYCLAKGFILPIHNYSNGGYLGPKLNLSEVILINPKDV